MFQTWMAIEAWGGGCDLARVLTIFLRRLSLGFSSNTEGGEGLLRRGGHYLSYAEFVLSIDAGHL